MEGSRYSKQSCFYKPADLVQRLCKIINVFNIKLRYTNPLVQTFACCDFSRSIEKSIDLTEKSQQANAKGGGTTPAIIIN